MPDINLPSHFYEAESLPLSAQRLVNLYAEPGPPLGKSRFALLGSAGLKPFGNVGQGPIRGMGVLNEFLYVVSGTELYYVTSGGAGTLISGGPIIGDKRVDMSPGRTEMAIINDSQGWVVDTANTLTQITDSDFQISSSVTHIDSYWVYSVADSKTFFLSNLNNALAYSALDTADKEASPDEIRAVFRDHRELWVFGKETTEIWYNAGDLDFPFTRISGAFIERGCLAAKSIASDDNTLFWLGDDKIVYRAAGYSPQRISTHAIEEAIQNETSPEDAFSFVYTVRGHKFYVLRFENCCFEYNLATQRWNERQSFDLPTWRANAFANAYGKNLVGDSQTGRIYELDPDTFDENGETIQRIAAFPPVGDDVPRIFNSRLQIVFESGVGLTTGQGNDPQAMLRWSDDGGRTWSNEHWVTIGKKGNYLTRALWRRLGRFRSRVYEVTVADPVKVSMIKAHVIGARGIS